MKLILSFFFLLIINFCFAQSNEDRARAYYAEALAAYNNKKYTECLSTLDRVESLLGQKTAIVEALRVKAYFDNSDLDNAQKHLDSFFKFKNASEDLRSEMLGYITKIDREIKRKEDEENQRKNIPSPASTVKGTVHGTTIIINYSQPSARGRKIMGELVPFGKVWRTGANETTNIEFDTHIKIENKYLPPGKYNLFTIPGENEWIIIFQDFEISWGAFKYTENKDKLRVSVKPNYVSNFIETFTIEVVNEGVIMSWENTQVALTLSK